MYNRCRHVLDTSNLRALGFIAELKAVHVRSITTSVDTRSRCLKSGGQCWQRKGPSLPYAVLSGASACQLSTCNKQDRTSG